VGDAHSNLQQSPCSECKNPAFHICYIGSDLVCLGCFVRHLKREETAPKST
jgi:hypothetical protein